MLNYAMLNYAMLSKEYSGYVSKSKFNEEST